MEGEIRKSTRVNKKYMSYHKGRWIHWGDDRYQHYFDSTPLKLYSHLNHNDETRKRNFYKRHGRTNDKSSSLWWSSKYLW